MARLTPYRNPPNPPEEQGDHSPGLTMGSPMDSPSTRLARKRRRPAVVCSECRRRKIACDRKTPCGQCALHNASCVYGTDVGVGSQALPARGLLSPSASSSSTSYDRQRHLQPEDRQFWQHANKAMAIPATDPQDADSVKLEAVVTAIMGPPVRIPRPGRLAKSRYFGQSHWMNNMDQFVIVHKMAYKAYFEPQSDLFILLRKCKQLARALKAHESQQIEASDAGPFIPPKETADILVGLYFQSFETVFRILHIPTFQEECRQYWENPLSASDVFMLKFQLVLALGSCFYEGPENIKQPLHLAAVRAVQKADSWHCSPIDKHRMNLDTIQIYCLVMLGRQTTALDVGDDIAWISTGSLLHTAFNMGMNRDPDCYVHVSPFHAELRRRLWATILELVVQSTCASGMPPLIREDDYDCRAPTNIPDDQLLEDIKTPLPAMPDETFTQATFQRLLYNSIPLRLRIARCLNGLGPPRPYDEILQLNANLIDISRSNSTTLHTMSKQLPAPTSQPPSPFGINLVDVLTRRFHWSLHAPYARKSATNIEFYYSRRIQLESTLKVLSLSSPPLQSGTYTSTIEPMAQLWVAGRGLFKAIWIDATSTVTSELVQQLKEDTSPGQGLGGMQRDMYAAVMAGEEAARRRVEEGETNIKGYVFFSCAVAQINALMEGSNEGVNLETVGREKLKWCCELMKDRVKECGIVWSVGDAEGIPGPDSLEAVDGNDRGPGFEAPPEMDDGDGGDGHDEDEWMDFYMQNCNVDFDSPDTESWFLPPVE